MSRSCSKSYQETRLSLRASAPNFLHMPFCPADTRVPDSTFSTAHAEDWVTGSNKLMGEVRKWGIKVANSRKEWGEGPSQCPYGCTTCIAHLRQPLLLRQSRRRCSSPFPPTEVKSPLVRAAGGLGMAQAQIPLRLLSAGLRPPLKGFPLFTGYLNTLPSRD